MERSNGMDSQLTLAFLTPYIHGHSNVHLTILHRLLTMKPQGVSRLAIHVIGDEPLRPRLASLPVPASHCTLAFHPMGTRDYLEDFVDTKHLKKPPPTFSNTGSLHIYRDITYVMNREPTEFLSRYSKLLDVLECVRPDMVVVDMLYRSLGVDACRKAGADWVILSPSSSLDFSSLTQPQGRGLWHYPALMSSMPYPVPWHLIPANIGLIICLIFHIVTSPYAKRLNAARNAAGLAGAAVGPMDEGTRVVIHASVPEIEYPHVPGPGTVFAGPIFERVPAISSSDYPELARFLDGGRTVLINLGSIFTYTEEEADAMAAAVVMARERLQDRGGFRVLWKLPKASSFAGVLERHFGKDREDTLIQEWIEPMSFAILQHPNLAVSVHHGGANTIIEDAYAGVPQVVLPMWFDLYTLAVRVETLGHGIYANRGHEPTFKARFIADALVRILRDRPGEEGHRIRAKAQELAKACQATEGDKTATDVILKAAMNKYNEIPYAPR